MSLSKQEADWEVGKWLSAALDDPTVCKEMKQDIINWMDVTWPDHRGEKS